MLLGRLLPLTQEEKSEMHKFIQEYLQRGTICMSKSPYAANFFMKKKDGKLRPVQDYQPINKWTKKNRNYPLLFPKSLTASMDAPSSQSWTLGGDTTTFRSKKGMKEKLHFLPTKDCSNQQLCSLG